MQHQVPHPQDLALEALVNQFLGRFPPIFLMARTMSVTIFLCLVAPRILFGFESLLLLSTVLSGCIEIYSDTTVDSVQKLPRYVFPGLLGLLSLVYLEAALR